MPAPEVSEAALELYEALEPAFTEGDEERGYPALNLCAALVSGNIDLIHQLVTDSEFGPGWQILFDAERVPAVWLPWLAQPAGAVLRPDMDEAQRRSTIEDPEAFGRGTVEQIEAVTKRRLTGTKAVIITERYTGNAWRLRIETIEAETPDPDLTEAEIRAEAKPIGLVLFFNSRAIWNWKELRAEFATWKDVEEEFVDWFAVRTFSP